MGGTPTKYVFINFFIKYKLMDEYPMIYIENNQKTFINQIKFKCNWLITRMIQV